MFDLITLPNGLRVVGEKLSHVRSCNIGIWVKVGSMNETPEENGMSLLEFSLQWLLNQPVVDSAIVGASKYEHIVQNLSLTSETKVLSPESLKKCDEIWATIGGQYFNYHGHAKPVKRPE